MHQVYTSIASFKPEDLPFKEEVSPPAQGIVRAFLEVRYVLRNISDTRGKESIIGHFVPTLHYARAAIDEIDYFDERDL